MKINNLIYIAVAASLSILGCESPVMSISHGDSHSMGDMHEGGHDMDSLVGAIPEGTLLSKTALFQRGKTIFEGICIHCHQMDGKGIVDSIPPLAGSDFLMADRKRSIQIVMYGIFGEITVNGKTFNAAAMPPISGSDGNVASVLTYVRNYFNAATDSIGSEEVMKARMAM